jgi:superfamily II DNA or RNA helicase
MLDITWSPPYTVREGFATKWRREWCIPPAMLSGFFAFWKPNRFKMLADGFTVIKSEKTGKWYLYETKDNAALFKVFGNSPAKAKPEDNFVLPPYTIKDPSGLRTWQVDAAGKLCSAITHWGSAIDGSDTGTGKTYTACAVARELGLKICVVCPKAVIKSWNKVIKKHFKMESSLIGVVNYEKLRNGKKDSPVASYVLHRHKKRPTFEWKLPAKTLIIWDESHKLKNWKTKNSKTCQAAIKAGYPMLFCSATNATNPLEMRAVGLALKLFNNSNSYYAWATENGVYKGNWGLEFNDDPKILKRLNKQIFDQRGVRLRRDDIPNFPKCEVIAEVYNMDDEDAVKINETYAEMERELAKLAKLEKKDPTMEAVVQLRMRQKVELIKVPLFVEMIEEAIEEGFSVALFVNFTDTLTAIAERLKTTCIFDGKTSDKVRDRNVELFQEDKERVILVNIQSGGAGLSLHDLNGNFPRMSIISPTFSPIFMRQTLGRIWRDDAKTKSIQRIVCVANTVEENVCRNVQQKLNNLDLLNDGDLSYGKNYEIISD